jgi:hypothetical protein
MSLIDLRGEVFGRLTVLHMAEAKSKDNHLRWFCQCECGNEHTTTGSNLRSGGTRSCGCLQRESRIKHGRSRTKEYHIWRSMNQRCFYPNHRNWKDYGGRGIKVCDRWRYGEGGKGPFECFYEDMGDKSAKLTLERINNDGNYEPSNCKWDTRKAQANNRRPRRLAELAPYPYMEAA